MNSSPVVAEEKSDIVRITGAPNNVARAQVAREQRIKHPEAKHKRRKLCSGELEMEVDRAGAVVSKIMDSVQVLPTEISAHSSDL